MQHALENACGSLSVVLDKLSSACNSRQLTTHNVLAGRGISVGHYYACTSTLIYIRTALRQVDSHQHKGNLKATLAG